MTALPVVSSSPANGFIKKYDRLLTVVAAFPGWVAFSGGVDSTLLLKAMVEVNPSQAMALFADSLLQSQKDRDNVISLSQRLGAKLNVVAITPLLTPDFQANLRERCYLCKHSVYRQFQRLLPKWASLLDGTNRDDLEAERPGQRAIDELGIVSPLVLAGLTKYEVREISRCLGLPNWNRPSSSCLATRIPEGFAITPELLRHVEQGESLIAAEGFGHVRMRLNKGRPEDVTIELASAEMECLDFQDRSARLEIVLRRLGIVRVSFVSRKIGVCL